MRTRTWRRGVTLAAAVSLVTVFVVVSGAASSADPTNPRPTPTIYNEPNSKPTIVPDAPLKRPTESADCNLTEAEKQKRLNAGKPNAICVRRINPALQVPGGRFGRSAPTQLPPPPSGDNGTANLPEWCRTGAEAPDQYIVLRFDVCMYGEIEVEIRHVQTNKRLLRVVFDWGVWAYANYNMTSFAESLGAELDSVSGTSPLTGLIITSGSECASWAGGPACNPFDHDGIGPEQVVPNYTHLGMAYFNTVPPAGSSAVFTGTPSLYFNYPFATPAFVDLEGGWFDCDNWPYFPVAGCRMWQYTPTLSFATSEMPAITAHMDQARNQGLAGFYHGEDPTAYCDQFLPYQGCGHPLTRQVHQYYIDQNRNNALAQCALLPPSPPEDDSCDEFPFASTQEPGYYGAVSVKMVPLAQNSLQGSRLSTQYYEQRVQGWDGTAGGDHFWVTVIA